MKNLANGEETYVRVNDRGPYAGENRIIDLSKAAFESIASLSSGVINVSITPVSGPPGGYAEPEASATCPDRPSLKYYSENTFENLTLNASLPNTYLVDEVFFLEGSSASSLSEVSAFLADDGEAQYPYYVRKADDSSFMIPVYFPDTGSFSLGLLPGESGSSIVERITVLPSSCLAESEDAGLPVPTDLQLGIDQGDLLVKWSQDDAHNVSKLTFSQGSKQKHYYLMNRTEFRPSYRDFEGWQNGQVQLKVQSGRINVPSFAEASSVIWSTPTSQTFNAEMHHQYVVETDKVKVIALPSTLKSGATLSLKVDPKVNVDEIGRVILPSGQVEDIALQSPTHNAMEGNLGISIYPSSASEVRLSYRPASSDIHFFEINDEQGIAAVNIPVYPENVYPLLPNPVDLTSLRAVNLGNDLTALRNEMLKLVNADRAAHGLAAVTLDSSLTQLAQARSDDMAERQYFSHWNPEGMNANDLRKNYAITQYVSENIARDVSVALAEYGLMRSASHRSNILNPEWQRVGLGVSDDTTNGTVFVQIFSDDPIDYNNLGQLRTEIVSELNKHRISAISLQDNLNSLAQSWSDKWVSETWCEIDSASCNPLIAPEASFTDSLRDAGVMESLGAYYRGDSSFDNAKEAISENSSLQENRWKKIGLGIKQDNLGIIHFIITYTE